MTVDDISFTNPKLEYKCSTAIYTNIMSKYPQIEKELDESGMKLIDFCKEKGLNYKSIKNGLYRYRKKKFTPTTNNGKSTRVSKVTHDTKDIKPKKQPSKPKKHKEITITQIIELAEQKMKEDHLNSKYQRFIKRAKSVKGDPNFEGKEQSTFRTMLELVNSLIK